MAGHRAALEQALGVPVIEPCQAAVAMALGIVVPGTQQAGQQNASRAA
jgi:Asp/Glu/hydantoin racemase